MKNRRTTCIQKSSHAGELKRLTLALYLNPSISSILKLYGLNTLSSSTEKFTCTFSFKIGRQIFIFFIQKITSFTRQIMTTVNCLSKEQTCAYIYQNTVRNSLKEDNTYFQIISYQIKFNIFITFIKLPNYLNQRWYVPLFYIYIKNTMMIKIIQK